VLDGGAGADVMVGGAGNDTYHVDNAGDHIDEFIAGGAGHDTIISKIALTTAVSRVEDYVFSTSTAVNFSGYGADNRIQGGTGADILHGGGGHDHILGGSGNDQLYLDSGSGTLEGEAGNDQLNGGAYNDILIGGTGADVMTGGGGNDTYVVDNLGDRIVEAAGDGILDHVISTVSIASLWANVDSAQLSGTALNLTGNALANFLGGNAYNNVIVGGGGDDRIAGSLGNDTLSGGAGGDTFLFSLAGPTSDGADKITDFDGTADRLLFQGVADHNGDHVLNLADLLLDVSDVVDHGDGHDVTVSFSNGASITFAGAGTGSIDSLTGLVASPTQIEVY